VNAGEASSLAVLHVISGLDPRQGGPIAVILGLCAAQAAAGIKVSVASTWRFHTHEETVEKLQRAGVTVTMIGPARDPMSRVANLPNILYPLIAGADVVHIHALWESIQHDAARVCQRMAKPYVMTPHGMLSPWNLAQNPWRKKMYLAWRGRRNLDRAAAIHYTCEVERDLAVPLHLRAPALVETLGIDADEFAALPPRGTFRAQYPQLGNRPLVLFLSRINYKKGLDLLIPAFAKASAASNATLVIAGPDLDGYQATVQALIDQHGINDRVIFTGMLAGQRRLEAYVDADLFALPSYQENFGIVVIEALACGCPVLISDQVNIHKQITRSGTGLVVPAQVGPVADALAKLLTDDAQRMAMAQKARASIIPAQTWPAIAARWIGHYQRLMAGAQ